MTHMPGDRQRGLLDTNILILVTRSTLMNFPTKWPSVQSHWLNFRQEYT